VPRKSATKLMLEFVQDYLDGTNERLDFDLDFNYYLKKYFPEMERENPDLAECFLFYIAERGFDEAQGLSNAAHKKLIKEQFDEFLSAMHDGFL